MIALDTNILARFIARDDEAQYVLAHDLIAGCSKARKAFISREVMIELTWVLRRSLKLPREVVAQALKRVALADMFEIEDRLDVQSAILAYETGKLDFADAMIAAAAERSGASELVTFDRRLATLSNVRLLEV
ncbi:PIN domain-containing protein [Maricaulaceae bacterium MS644]